GADRDRRAPGSPRRMAARTESWAAGSWPGERATGLRWGRGSSGSAGRGRASRVAGSLLTPCLRGDGRRRPPHCSSGRHSIPEDEVEIARVDEHAPELTDDEHRITPMKRVGEQDDRAGNAEVPELHGHDALLLSLGRDPLQEEAQEEAGLTEQADDQPDQRRILTIHGSPLEAPAFRAFRERC